MFKLFFTNTNKINRTRLNFRKNFNYLILILFTPSTNKSWKPFLQHKSFLSCYYWGSSNCSVKRGSSRCSTKEGSSNCSARRRSLCCSARIGKSTEQLLEEKLQKQSINLQSSWIAFLSSKISNLFFNVQ